MDYKRPYTYFAFKPTTGTMNLLWGSLLLFSASIIPVLGQIVWHGYQSDVLKELDRDLDRAEHPDFDLNRFGEYLITGFWIWLMQLITGLFSVFASMIVLIPVLIYAGRTNQPELLVVGYLGMVPVFIIATIFSWPLTLHACITRAFRFGAAMAFTWEFLRRLWGQLLVTLIVHSIISGFIGLLGFAACCIGIFPATTIIVMAQQHYMVQLYQIYLDEDGTPIDVEDERSESEEEM